MNIHLGNKFDSHFDEVLKNKNENFWNDVLNNFRNEKDYEKKLHFFTRYELNLQTEYKPQIPFWFDSTELNLMLVTYDNMLLQEGINEVNPNDEFLIQWYLKQNVESSKELSTIESRNFVLFQHRFKLKVMPEGYFDNDKKTLFNRYLEEQITENYPEVLVSQMIKDYQSKDVPNRKIQIQEILRQIKTKIQSFTEKRDKPLQEIGALKSAELMVNLQSFYYNNKEEYKPNEFDFLEGYSRCKSDGANYVPIKNKITYDFILGKNTALFEIFLLELSNELNTDMNETQLTNKIKIKWNGNKNQLYHVLRILKIEHELITNSFNDLAEFIKLNVVGFENTSKETIEKELKKKKPIPKDKRIKIELPK